MATVDAIRSVIDPVPKARARSHTAQALPKRQGPPGGHRAVSIPSAAAASGS